MVVRYFTFMTQYPSTDFVAEIVRQFETNQGGNVTFEAVKSLATIVLPKLQPVIQEEKLLHWMNEHKKDDILGQLVLLFPLLLKQDSSYSDATLSVLVSSCW